MIDGQEEYYHSLMSEPVLVFLSTKKAALYKERSLYLLIALVIF